MRTAPLGTGLMIHKLGCPSNPVLEVSGLLPGHLDTNKLASWTFYSATY